jgi:excisionase family DNA binding protein
MTILEILRSRAGQALTVDEVAELLHLHRNTVSLWASKGTFPAFKAGSDYRFDPQLVADWIEANQNAHNRVNKGSVNLGSVRPGRLCDGGSGL